MSAKSQQAVALKIYTTTPASNYATSYSPWKRYLPSLVLAFLTVLITTLIPFPSHAQQVDQNSIKRGLLEQSLEVVESTTENELKHNTGLLTSNAQHQQASKVASDLARRGELAQATQQIEEVLVQYAGASADATVQANLGTVRLYQGNFQQAIDAINASLGAGIESEYISTLYLHKSLALRALGRYAESQQAYLTHIDTQNERYALEHHNRETNTAAR